MRAKAELGWRQGGRRDRGPSETDGRVGSTRGIGRSLRCGGVLVVVVVTRRGVLALGQWRLGCVSMRSMRRYGSAERGRARR